MFHEQPRTSYVAAPTLCGCREAQPHSFPIVLLRLESESNLLYRAFRCQIRA
jgi:hypothetical protein